MEPLAPGSVVLVRFPFSDLSSTKLRPALVVAAAGNGDWILCQITSNPYADPLAVELENAYFSHGSLHRVSYARPAKLFTASSDLVVRHVGVLYRDALMKVISAIVDVITGNSVVDETA